MSNPLRLAELSNVSKTYGNNSSPRQILQDINFSVFSGNSIAIIGPSGSGKSTLLNILGLLDTATSGTVRFRGKDAMACTSDELSELRNKNIGFVFQMHYLLPQLNLIENIMVPVIPEKDKAKRKLALARAMELLDHVGLSDKAIQRPGQLSVGECQRAAVVRALINEPELILADEPTGSLDHDASEQLGNLLSGLCKNFTVGLVLVTHAPELAMKMKKSFRLLNGKLLAAV
jgi:ABC-type lipoprotein export system ATPase subunit